MSVRILNTRKQEVLTHTIHLEQFATLIPLKVSYPSFLYCPWKVFQTKTIIYEGSCADFGSSGSGVVREWRKYAERPSVDFKVDYTECFKKNATLVKNCSDTGAKEEHFQHSFVGPLSMSKGCDLSLDIVPEDYEEELDNIEFIYRGI